MADKDDIAWWSKGRIQRKPGDSSVSSLKKFLPNIAKDVGFIKQSLMSLVKIQETDKKTQYFERQKRRSEDYTSRYKKVKPTKEDKKVITAEKKSSMDIIKDGLSNIFKFALLGLIAIGASKLLSLPGVMDGLKNFMKKFILGVSDLIQKGIGFLTDIMKDNEIINSLTNLIKKVFTFIADGISKGADIIKNIITDPENKDSIGKIIVAVIGTVFNGLMSAIDIAGKALTENQDSIRNGVVTIFEKLASGIAGAVSFATELVKDPRFVQAVAKIYESLKDFFNTIFNEPLVTIAGQPVNLKMALITLGAGFVLLEGAMAALTGLIAGKAAANALGLPSGGGGPAGPAGPPGKKSLKQKFFEGVSTGVQLLSGAAISYGIYKSVTGFSDAAAEAKKREEERGKTPTSPIRARTEGPATAEQKGSAVTVAKTFAGKSGADFISSMEGFAGKAYLDPPNNTKGQYSVGHGHLITEAEIKQGFINLGNGKKIEVKGPGGKDTTISKEEAKALLNSDIPKYEAIASKQLGADAWTKLNQDQRNALTSLAYNSGAGGIEHLVKNGLRDAILKGDIEAASKIIYEKGYKMSGGKQLAGLDTRRLKEATLFAGASSEAPTQMAAAEPPKPGAATSETTKPTANKVTSAAGEAINSGAEKAKSFGNQIMDLLAGENDFMKQLDEMTGGKLGLASNDLAKAVRTRNMTESGDTIDGSTNITGDTSVTSTQPLPSIYDETLLSKISIA